MLNDDFKKVIADRLEGWELVEFLQIPIEEVVDFFEEEILENFEDVEEFIGLKGVVDNDDQ